MLIAVASMVIAAVATVFAFNLVRPIYDQILQPVPAEESATGLVAVLERAVARSQNLLQEWIGESRSAILALALLAIVIKNIFAFLARFAAARYGLATIRDLRTRFFESLLTQSPAYFIDRSTAALMKVFYHRLWKEDKPPIVALREAQLFLYRNPDLIDEIATTRGPDLSNPTRLPDGGRTQPGNPTTDVRKWAGFVLSGPGY